MRRFLLPILILLMAIFCLKYVASPPKDEVSEKSAQENREAPKRQISEAEREEASRILDFFNTVENSMDEDWFTQADHIAFFVRIYLGEWQLPKYGKTLIDQKTFRERLSPPNDLFDEDMRKTLEDAIVRMYGALAKMHASYRELERYVADSSTTDDGVRGKKLSEKINAAYATFGRAKKDYFFQLEKRAIPAEDIFLADNPIRRQILEARVIFQLLRSISYELSRDTVDLTKTRALEGDLQAHIVEAERPPFKGKPLTEKQYRAFLKEVRHYAGDLAQGNREGFYPHVRSLLNTDLANVRSGYNAFVQYLNENEK